MKNNQEQDKLKSFHKDLDKIEKQIIIPANTLKVGDVFKLGDAPMFDPTKDQYTTITIKEVMENKKEPLMSAELYYDNNNTHKTTTAELMQKYANYLLSYHINVLAERIANNYSISYMTDDGIETSKIKKEKVLKIANDYINELNLQSSK